MSSFFFLVLSFFSACPVYWSTVKAMFYKASQQSNMRVLTGLWCGGEELLWYDRWCSGRESSPVQLPPAAQWGIHMCSHTHIPKHIDKWSWPFKTGVCFHSNHRFGHFVSQCLDVGDSACSFELVSSGCVTIYAGLSSPSRDPELPAFLCALLHTPPPTFFSFIRCI